MPDYIIVHMFYLSRGQFLPMLLNNAYTARLKPLLRTTKSCGLLTESVPTDFRSLEQGIYPGGSVASTCPKPRG
jgi:hypothetical protein